MYGLVVENVAAYIKVKHGKDAWENIRRLANIDTPSFSIHQVKLAPVVKIVHNFDENSYKTLGNYQFFFQMNYHFPDLS